MHILFLIQSAFSLWMLIDAAQRRVPHHWYYIILMPFGECVYFFAIKIHDPQFSRMKGKFLKKRISLKEIRYRAKNSPSEHNRLLLAQALYDQGEFQEAAELFREIAKADQKNKSALHGLGLCLVNLRESKDAIITLEKLVSLDIGYDDFSPCADLAQAYWENGEKDSAVSLLEKVCKKSQRLCHKTELAAYLAETNRAEEARGMLEDSLMDYENSPRYVKKKDRPWAKKARSLMRKI